MRRLQVNAQVVLGGEDLSAVLALFRFFTSVCGVVCSQLLCGGEFVLALVALVLLEVRLQMGYHVVHLVRVVPVAVVALEVERIAAQYGVVINPGLGGPVVVVLFVDLWN